MPSLGGIGKFVNNFRNSNAQKEDEMKRYGISFIKDNKLGERVYVMNQVHSVLESTEWNLDEKVDWINRAVHIVAVPWGRGGDIGKYALLTMYWEIIVKEWNDYKTLRTTDPQISSFQKDEMNNLIDGFAWREVIPYGWMIINVSFQEKDVSPQTVAMIQSIMPMGQGGITPSSTATVDKPTEKTYEDRLSAGIDEEIKKREEAAAVIKNG